MTGLYHSYAEAQNRRGCTNSHWARCSLRLTKWKDSFFATLECEFLDRNCFRSRPPSTQRRVAIHGIVVQRPLQVGGGRIRFRREGQ